jgi:ribonucleoside-diphosphate reductase alpha chain
MTIGGATTDGKATKEIERGHAEALGVGNANHETDGNAAGSHDSRLNVLRRTVRRHLPDERRSITHKFSVGGQEGYLTVGLYEDGIPGELFITMAKEGSTVSGLMDAFATAVSLALQYGVPLQVLCSKFSHMRFEPSGWTSNAGIGYAKSVMDYIFRWLELRFLRGEQGSLFGSSPLPAVPGQAAACSMPAATARDSVAPSDIRASCGSVVRRGENRCPPCGERIEVP